MPIIKKLNDKAIVKAPTDSELASSAHVIQDEGVDQTQRQKLNFIGAGVTATDNAGNNSTDITIPGGASGPDPINSNYVINGNFDFWQRNTLFTNAGAGTKTADRWTTNKQSTTAVVDIRRSTNVPSGASAGFTSLYSLECDVTTADASITGTDSFAVRYNVEGYDFQYLYAQECTLSFWVYATVTGTSCISFVNGANNRTYIAEYTINSSNTWEKKEITLTMDTAGTWNFNQNLGLQVHFILASGASYHTSAGTWQNTFSYSTGSQVNHLSSTSNFFRLSQVKIELGATATTFKRAGETREGELAKCQRYYEKSYLIDTVPGTAVGGFSSATWDFRFQGSPSVQRHTMHFATEKRAQPTMTYYRPDTASTTGQYLNNSGGATGRTVTQTGTTTKSSKIEITPSGSETFISLAWTADCDY